MHLNLLPLACLASTVLADGASILAAIGTISNSTTALDKVVLSFPPGLLGLADVFPLLIASTKLLSDIHSGTTVAQNSANLTVAEAIGIAGATQSLSTTVNKTLTDVIAAKSKFDGLLIVSPTTLLNLKLEKKATDQFGDAVVEKIPEALQGIAKSLLAPVDDSFDEAIAAYE